MKEGHKRPIYAAAAILVSYERQIRDFEDYRRFVRQLKEHELRPASLRELLALSGQYPSVRSRGIATMVTLRYQPTKDDPLVAAFRDIVVPFHIAPCKNDPCKPIAGHARDTTVFVAISTH